LSTNSSILPSSENSLDSTPFENSSVLITEYPFDTSLSFENILSSIENNSNLEEGIISSTHIIKKKNNKRKPVPIHDYLDILEDGSHNCKLCNNKWGTNTSLSTITCHFENKHLHTFQNLKRNTKVTYLSLYSTVERIERNCIESLNKDLWEWIVLSQQPFSVVEEAPLIKLFNNFDSCYKTPCRQTISTTVKKQFDLARNK
ncbi:12757_t:CDS:1, partial [Acaulospora morrowiae]